MKLFGVLATIAALAATSNAEDAILFQEGDFKITIDAADMQKATDGRKPSQGDKIAAHYAGRLLDGKQFDSSYDRGQPLNFNVGSGMVIKCWDTAFMHLVQGVKAQLYCPADWAYGSRGAGGVIPPNSDLIFDVELVENLSAPKIDEL